jgi:hypothetical protein
VEILFTQARGEKENCLLLRFWSANSLQDPRSPREQYRVRESKTYPLELSIGHI